MRHGMKRKGRREESWRKRYLYTYMESEGAEGPRGWRGRGEVCREIHLRDPRALFVAPLSKDEPLEAFVQTAAS